jgi:hypothetical protein
VHFEHADPERHPALIAAGQANQLNPRQIFEHTVRSYLLGVAHFGAIGTAGLPAAAAKTVADLDQTA